MRLRSFLAVLLISGVALSAPGAELYGKPLRGLTPVSIVELQRKAAGFDGKTIQVRGTVHSQSGAFSLTEGAASLRVTMSEPGATLPSDATGATATAEGVFRAKGIGGGPAIEATGLELTR
ncbi:MAG TPA: hypothetical protein VE129_00880 [Thermoanaerobaculia bacterium]|nr:hypothetical protein [Thermoanaerobaculia bacterium]